MSLLCLNPAGRTAEKYLVLALVRGAAIEQFYSDVESGDRNLHGGDLMSSLLCEVDNYASVGFLSESYPCRSVIPADVTLEFNFKRYLSVYFLFSC